jgi:ATP-binding cassette, subfamily B, bacterial CvaB/MchF/RaxB
MTGMALPDLGFGRRLPMVLQTEGAECGLACLAMLAGYHGQPTDAATLRREHGFSLKGASLKDLIRVADRLGFACRPLRLELDELAALKTPCILHWDLNHFVVLQGIGRGGVVIHDPAVGIRRLSFDQVSRHFTGVAVELTPTGGFETTAPPPRVKFRSLLGRLVGVKRALGQLLGLALALELFAMASPLFMGLVIDHALVGADHQLLLTLVLAFALLLLLQVALTAMRGWMIIALGASLTVQARTNLFSHLLRLPAAFFEARHMGDVMSRFESQDTILGAITTDLVVAVLDGLMAIVTLTIMLLIAPGLTMIVLAVTVVYGVLRWVLYMPLRQASLEAIVWGARQDSHFLETLRGIKTIKLFNAQEDRRAHWLNLLVETVNRDITKDKLELLFRVSNRLLLGGLALGIVYFGASSVIAGTLSVGLLVAFMAYQSQFVGRVSDLIDTMVDLTMLRLHGERLADIALSEPEPGGLHAVSRTRHRPVGVEARGLAFAYSANDPLVLDGVDFTIAPGESVAIVGPSGCGKTTLLKILAGLVQPTAGKVLIDGAPLGRLGLDRYRAMLGVVMQDDQLFAGSIADNITFFAPDADAERVEACAKKAAIHDDITAMPMGYGTLIGDMGTVLSGGQKQRVLIARALYRQPSLLLLDEATSHLDVDREAKVNAAIAATSMTRIIIAHRPETIRACDRVIALKAGRVVLEHTTRLSLDHGRTSALANPARSS